MTARDTMMAHHVDVIANSDGALTMSLTERRRPTRDRAPLGPLGRWCHECDERLFAGSRLDRHPCENGAIGHQLDDISAGNQRREEEVAAFGRLAWVGDGVGRVV